MNTAKKILTVVLSIVLWVVILLAALFAFTTLASRDTSSVASLAGFTPMTVQSDSMVPFFETGDLIVIRKCNPDELQVGDVITFHTIIQNQYALNTHRIASITETNGVRSYTTKGDNNLISDTHVIANGDIVGKYVGKAPGLGRLLDFMSGSVGFLLIIVLPMLIFFIYQVYHLVIVSINLKKAMAIENALAAQEALASQQPAPQSGETENEAKRIREEAEAALAEAKRLKEEAEAALAKAKAEAEAAAAAPEETPDAETAKGEEA